MVRTILSTSNDLEFASQQMYLSLYGFVYQYHIYVIYFTVHISTNYVSSQNTCTLYVLLAIVNAL